MWPTVPLANCSIVGAPAPTFRDETPHGEQEDGIGTWNFMLGCNNTNNYPVVS